MKENKRKMKDTGEKIIINFDDEHSKETTIREVLRLVEEGYTSGYYPNWEIITED